MSVDPAARPLITQPVDVSRLITLTGNKRPEANARNDRGPVPDNLPMEHMLLQLRRPAERERALEQFIEQLHDRSSPNFHHWLSAQELGQRYGLAHRDLDAITRWLKAYGFAVNRTYPAGVTIDFSGTAGQVREAFHAEIHYLEKNGVRHIANMTDPRIPAALAPAIAGVVSLNNFMPHPMNRPRPGYTVSSSEQLVVPADLATIYNFTPLYKAGYSGQGQTIAIIQDSDAYNYPGDWDTFRSTFGLASAYPGGSLTQIHPGGCTDPGVIANTDAETAIDVEWSSAAAPNAAIELASCADTTTNFGGFIAMQNLLSSSPPPAIMSISFGDSETDLGASANAYIYSLYQQAVTEGVSVFVSAGDEGAAASDYNAQEAVYGINVSGFASTPFNVAVGGTDFGDAYAGTVNNYWSSTNTSDYGSALSYIPEIPWNDSCASLLIADYLKFSTTYGSGGLCNSSDASTFGLLTVTGGSGGPSGCATGTPATPEVVGGSCAGYPKPAWQSVFGNPRDGVRDLPDVSIFASNGEWGHYYPVCWSDTANGGASCSGTPDTWAGFGGTSVAAPIMAGIQALANQVAGARQGNPNPTYYSLASKEYGTAGSASCNSTLGNGAASSCIFYDVTQGDMDQPCTGSNNCYTPSGTYGVLSTSDTAYQPAYTTSTGWDFATGIGTVNAYNLAMAFNTSAATPTATSTPTSTPTATATPTATPTADALLRVKPLAIRFSPKVVLGTQGVTSPLRQFALLNPKNRAQNAPITIGSIASTDSEFQPSSNCNDQVLAAGGRCVVSLTFTPTSPGPHSAALIVPSNARNGTRSVAVRGLGRQGLLVYRPHLIRFGRVAVGTPSGPATVTLINSNPVPMGITGFSTTDSEYRVTPNCGATLDPGGTCQVTVTFTPESTGPHPAKLSIADNAAHSPQQVTLLGRGR